MIALKITAFTMKRGNKSQESWDGKPGSGVQRWESLGGTPGEGPLGRDSWGVIENQFGVNQFISNVYTNWL